MVLCVPAAVRFITVAEASRFKDAFVVAVDYLCEFALVKALLCLERVKYVKKSLFHAPDYRRRRNPSQQRAGAPWGNVPLGALCEHHEQVARRKPIRPQAGKVSTHARTMLRAIPQLTRLNDLLAPTP